MFEELKSKSLKISYRFKTSIIRLAYEYPKFESCGGPLWTWIEISKEDSNVFQLIYHCLIDRIRCFVRKNTCRKARNDFFHTGFVGYGKDIIVDLHVVSLKRNRILQKTSLNNSFLTKKSRFRLKFLNKPPTSAAKWMTCVGRYLSNKAFVCSRFLRSKNILVLFNKILFFSLL